MRLAGVTIVNRNEMHCITNQPLDYGRRVVHTPNPVTITWISFGLAAGGEPLSGNSVAFGGDAGPQSPIRKQVKCIDIKGPQEKGSVSEVLVE
jgi:hypothetical protein